MLWNMLICYFNMGVSKTRSNFHFDIHIETKNLKAVVYVFKSFLPQVV